MLLGVSAVSRILAQRGSADPEFAKVPFEQWLSGAGQAQIKWTARILPATLSSFQRLLAGIEVRVDGAELARRRGEGQLMIFVQLSDETGAAWQDHGTIDLEKVEAGLKSSDVLYTESAFVLPGDYRVAIAIFDTATGEHSVRKDKLHVAPLKNDPLPQAWRDLPPVEFRPAAEPPDSWFLPTLTGRLYLPLEVKRPIRIDVFVNLTPSERVSGSLRARDRNLGALLPALKTISQIDSTNASLNVTLLDLSRRRVIFHQEQVRELDWPAMKTSIEEADPGTIDVKSLADRRHNAEFFVTEVSRRIDPRQSTPPARVVIVLSSPVAFEPGEDLRPIQIAPAPDCRVFYFRFHAAHRPAGLCSAWIGWQAPSSGCPDGSGPAGGARPACVYSQAVSSAAVRCERPGAISKGAGRHAGGDGENSELIPQRPQHRPRRPGLHAVSGTVGMTLSRSTNADEPGSSRHWSVAILEEAAPARPVGAGTQQRADRRLIAWALERDEPEAV